MFLHMMLEISGARLPTGTCSMRSSVGGSVASASAPSVSMIRFTHSSWTAVKGTVPPAHAATKLTVNATTLTVSWNWMNFWMLAYTARPHRTT